MSEKEKTPEEVKINLSVQMGWTETDMERMKKLTKEFTMKMVLDENFDRGDLIKELAAIEEIPVTARIAIALMADEDAKEFVTMRLLKRALTNSSTVMRSFHVG